MANEVDFGGRTLKNATLDSSVAGGGGVSSVNGRTGEVAISESPFTIGFEPQGIYPVGSGNYANGAYSSVLGGQDNVAQGSYSVIGGGRNNTAYNVGAVLGGATNNASMYCVVVGGYGNNATGYRSSILGGYNNSTNQQVNAHIIGSGITADSSNTTFVNALKIVDANQGITFPDGSTIKSGINLHVESITFPDGSVLTTASGAGGGGGVGAILDGGTASAVGSGAVDGGTAMSAGSGVIDGGQA